ncbi:DNA polymerase [Callinectes sapidus nudivirus]|nr:DNA polymerase [Callinectes sapidus nudivirus]
MAPFNYVKIDNDSQNTLLSSLPTTTNPIYVLDWQTENASYFAIGIDESYQYAKLEIKNLESGLFVWALEEKILKHMLVNLNIGKIESFEHVGNYCNNNVTVFDSLADPHRYENNWKLFKIKTENFIASKNLYNQISNNQNMSHYIATLGQWNISTFLMMEMHVRKKKFIYCVHINKNLEYVPAWCDMGKLPIVVFDIETVSNHDHRLPMGNYIADHIMSVTVIKNTELITLCNLPVDNSIEIDKAQKLVDEVDWSKYYYVKSRKCLIFNNERDLLHELFSIFDSIENPYICLGYNSRGYDMPFLLNRCAYLNLPQLQNFYFMHGILSYGKNMIHIDMNQVLVKFFAQELSSFSLKNVAKVLLSEDKDTQKLDVNARNLRYIYKFMDKENSINDGKFNNTLCNQPTEWEITLALLVKYNEMDCLVVLALWNKLQYESFLQYTSRQFFLPFVRVTLSKLSEYISGDIINEGLKMNAIFSKHHNFQTICNNKFMMKINNDTIASSGEDSSYGGGFNFRLAKNAYSSVQAFDALAYYPHLIAGMNLSHETISITTVCDFLYIIENSPEEFVEEDFKILKFCTHKSMGFNSNNSKSMIKIDQSVAPFAYINHFIENCPQLNTNDLRNKCNGSDKIVVIHMKKRGVLSKIVEDKNRLRNLAKENKKAINDHINCMKQLLSNLNLGIEIENNDFDDFEDSDDESDSAKINFEKYEYSDYILSKPTNQSDAEWFVSIQLLLLPQDDILKYKEPKEALISYLEDLEKEHTRINSHYRNMKLINNSIYGLLGSSYGAIKSKNIAAIVTMLGRCYIILAAQIGNRINGNTVYSDTDSVYIDISNAIVQNPQKHIVDAVNISNPAVILNSKTYRFVFIIGRKTYIAMHGDAIFSRGINKNGPELWNAMLHKFYRRFIVNGEDLTCDGVSDVLFNMYKETYDSVSKNKNQVLRTVSSQNREDYKKDTPMTKLMDRISKEVPTYTFGSKVTCFYKCVGDVSEVHYAMDFELVNTDAKDINLLKFYSNMTMSFFAIISYAIERTAKINHDVVIKFSSSQYRKIEKLSYLRLIDSMRDKR